MSISKEAVLKALSHVDDPDLHKDVVTLGMIENLTIEGLNVSFDLVLTTPACPMKDMMVSACKNAVVYMVDAAAQVHVNATSRVVQNERTSDTLSGVKQVIAVA